ncbi:hypothetical protein [Lysobacter gummosus]
MHGGVPVCCAVKRSRLRRSCPHPSPLPLATQGDFLRGAGEGLG